MQSFKWLILAMAVALVASSAQAQDLEVAPEQEAQEQLDAFNDVPERTPKAGIEELTVTAQRKEETLQEVPIAVTAFNSEALEMQQISQFTDLQFSAPNVTFNASNFGGGGNFAIRGVGSATVATSGSAGVAFHVNEAAIPTFIFQTEFYDIERVEILRGPQGTLYGQNATGGVVNVVTKKPNFDEVGAELELDYGNYNSLKFRGAVNVPITDWLAVRVAALTLQRDGMIENLYRGGEVASDNIDGRDLWSIRATIAADITDTTYAEFYWSRFSENDNRARVKKTLCNPTNTPQLGCSWEGSIDTQQAALPYPQSVAGNIFAALGGLQPWGPTPDDLNAYTPELLAELDGDRRKIYTDMEPIYQADESVYMMQVFQELPADLSMQFIGAYVTNESSGSQDFDNSVGASFYPDADGNPTFLPVSGTSPYDWSDQNLEGIFAGNIFRTDDRVFGYDKAFGNNKTWYGEARISSDYEGPLNFTAGLNYSNARVKTGYNVLSNTLESVALDATPITFPYGPLPGLPIENNGELIPLRGLYPSFYFNQTNPYVANSLGVYGEGYWNITDQWKFTGGIRYNRNNKTIRDRQTLLNDLSWGGGVGTPPVRNCLIDTNPVVPGNQFDFQCIGSPSNPPERQPIGPIASGGTVSCDPNDPDGPKDCIPGEELPPYNFGRTILGTSTDETWNAFTGRANIDYATELPFTDETLMYLQWSRGYRPGGFNPAVDPTLFEGVKDTFDAEFVNAVEFGMKNRMMDLGLIANLAVFYYNYNGYQISKIQNRTAINENIDADVWGIELESMWAVPWLPGALLDVNLSYLGSRIKNSKGSVDPRDPSGERFGQDRLFLAKDQTFANPCVLDKQKFVDAYYSGQLVGPGEASGQADYIDEPITFVNPDTNQPDPNGVPSLVYCNGAGIDAVKPGPETIPDDPQYGEEVRAQGGYAADINGNELPDAPTFSFKIGAQYTIPVDYLSVDITPRTDFYWQTSMWGRIYNGPLDKIPSWYRWDLQLIAEDQEARWFIRGYVKNVLNDANITGFTVLDAAVGNFTNIQVIEPRLFGFAVGANF